MYAFSESFELESMIIMICYINWYKLFYCVNTFPYFPMNLLWIYRLWTQRQLESQPIPTWGGGEDAARRVHQCWRQGTPGYTRVQRNRTIQNHWEILRVWQNVALRCCQNCLSILPMSNYLVVTVGKLSFNPGSGFAVFSSQSLDVVWPGQ